MLLSNTDIDLSEFNEPISGGKAPYQHYDTEKVGIVLLDKELSKVS